MKMKHAIQCHLGKAVRYEQLSGKEQESFNAAHLKSLMATWGYLEAFVVNGDKHGADLLFYRSSDGNVLKVQLKGRPTIHKEYANKDIYVAYEDKKTGKWYVYNHDTIMNEILALGKCAGTQSWDERGSWSWSSSPAWLATIMKKWIVPAVPREAYVSHGQKWSEDWLAGPDWEMT
jgi:hypothetical protein